ncbi:hypothetical protein [Streptomyces sp. NPDC048644]|uniref:hypothetical protein n=1 Tax=Streptomyces sp. NPDC048644 TaxID=3365582 RepID=UPI003716D466
MQLHLPVQGVVNRSKPLEPFLVAYPFDDEGVASLVRREVGQAFGGGDVNDPGPVICHDTEGEECPWAQDPGPGDLF